MFQSGVRVLVGLFILSSLVVPVSAAGDRWQDRKVKVGDIDVRYLEEGSGDSIIVFMTGWTLTSEMWKEQIPYFAARGFRVIAFDPRSQGKTTQTETGNTYRQHAADLYAFLLKVRAEHCFLVAWDSAVNTVLEYVSSPDSVRPNKVILVDGYPSALKKDDYPGTTTLSLLRAQFHQIEEDRKKFAEQYVQGLFKKPQDASFLKNMIKSSLKVPIGASISLLFDIATGDRLPALSRISVPTLIISTPENRLAGEYMQSKIPRGNLVVIDDSGHAVFVDKPQAFNQAVEDFIGEN